MFRARLIRSIATKRPMRGGVIFRPIHPFHTKSLVFPAQFQFKSFSTHYKTNQQDESFSDAPSPGKHKKLKCKMAMAIGVGLCAAVYKYHENDKPKITLKSLTVSDFPSANKKEEKPILVEQKKVNQTELKETMEIIQLDYSDLYKTHLLCDKLSTPEDALKLTSFNQKKLISLIALEYPELNIDFDSIGICYGLTVMWHLYQSCNRDLLVELNQIVESIKSDDIPLNDTQIKLIQDISAIQENQKLPIEIRQAQDENHFLTKKFILFREQEPVNYMQYKEHFVTNAMKQAMIQPGSLIGILPLYGHKNEKNEDCIRGGHILGLKAHYVGDKFTFSYFDSNFREVIFDNEAACRANLSRLLSMYINHNYLEIRPFYAKENHHGLFWKRPSFMSQSSLTLEQAQNKEKMLTLLAA